MNVTTQATEHLDSGDTVYFEIANQELTPPIEENGNFLVVRGEEFNIKQRILPYGSIK